MEWIRTSSIEWWVKNPWKFSLIPNMLLSRIVKTSSIHQNCLKIVYHETPFNVTHIVTKFFSYVFVIDKFFFSDESFFRVLYNSDMTFAKRMYVSLDVDLTRIRLHQPISNIVKQPLLYVRDMLPRNCFLAVTRLHQVWYFDPFLIIFRG